MQNEFIVSDECTYYENIRKDFVDVNLKSESLGSKIDTFNAASE